MKGIPSKRKRGSYKIPQDFFLAFVYILFQPVNPPEEQKSLCN